MHAYREIKAGFFRKFSDKQTKIVFFLGAVLLHLIIFLLVATLVIWKAPEPPLNPFQRVNIKIPPPPPPAPPSSGASANNPMEPEPVVEPAVTPPSIIANQNSIFKIDATTAINETMSHLADHLPQGTGLGPSGGGSGSGPGLDTVHNPYGSKVTQGPTQDLVGNIYDLKQTTDGQPTSMAENEFERTHGEGDYNPGPTSPEAGEDYNFVRKFVRTWDMDLLSNYYKSPIELSTTQIAIPLAASNIATQAFGVQDKIRARRWIAIYTTTINPTESGRYRFIGKSDDFLIVRVNDENVLDASLTDWFRDNSVNGTDDVGGYICGKWFQMDPGDSVPIKILIGEAPGGFSGFLLMIQKEGDNSPKGDYAIFQTKDTPVPDGQWFPPSKRKMIFDTVQK